MFTVEIILHSALKCDFNIAILRLCTPEKLCEISFFIAANQSIKGWSKGMKMKPMWKSINNMQKMRES
jgi:hypothetical protein